MKRDVYVLVPVKVRTDDDDKPQFILEMPSIEQVKEMAELIWYSDMETSKTYEEARDHLELYISMLAEDMADALEN